MDPTILVILALIVIVIAMFANKNMRIRIGSFFESQSEAPPKDTEIGAIKSGKDTEIDKGDIKIGDIDAGESVRIKDADSKKAESPARKRKRSKRLGI